MCLVQIKKSIFIFYLERGREGTSEQGAERERERNPEGAEGETERSRACAYLVQDSNS